MRPIFAKALSIDDRERNIREDLLARERRLNPKCLEDDYYPSTAEHEDGSVKKRESFFVRITHPCFLTTISEREYTQLRCETGLSPEEVAQVLSCGNVYEAVEDDDNIPGDELYFLNVRGNSVAAWADEVEKVSPLEILARTAE